MKNILILLPAFLIFSVSPLQAQHAHHSTDSMSMPMHDSAEMHSMHHAHGEMNGMEMGGMNMSMNHAFSLNLPMSRNGSGTGWLPDASPMYGYMVHKDAWMFRCHGDIFPRFNQSELFKSGKRGAGKWDGPKMLMAMGQRKAGPA